MTGARLAMVEFPADDPQRALRFWSGVLARPLVERVADQGIGWQSQAAAHPGEPDDGRDGRVAPVVGVHERGRGPGDTQALAYFAVEDLPGALERVRALGGSVVHPGERWAICRDSEGSPFGLTARVAAAEG